VTVRAKHGVVPSLAAGGRMPGTAPPARVRSQPGARPTPVGTPRQPGARNAAALAARGHPGPQPYGSVPHRDDHGVGDAPGGTPH